jgi:hypothetical protein
VSAIAPEEAWPSATSLPLARPDISFVPVEGNVAIYDEVGHVLLMLNATAAAVLEMCDGVTPFNAMVSELAEGHAADADAIRDEVWHTVRKLASIGLVADTR